MLSYPFGKRQSPDPGSIKEVAEGVYWLRMALPFALDHINLWLLEDIDSWTIVDTGIYTEFTRDVWDSVINNYLENKPVNRVIVTHMHPDHIGCAGWLAERFNCELYISQLEIERCQQIIETTSKPVTEFSINFYREAGYKDEQLDLFVKNFGRFSKIVSNLPESYQRLSDGDKLIINGRLWEVTVGSGHSPEHVCLFCPDLKLLISGDQVLPRITSNISVFPIATEANPLASWLDSCARLREILPDDLLILPAHQEPFYGLHHRLTELIESHEKVLKRLLQYLNKPSTAINCILTMFEREINPSELQFAIGETLAHLNYHIHQGKVTVKQDENGINYYSSL